MYAPVRAGTRGGQGDFKWEDVKNDVDRENYLGHSVLAPKGRWQNGRDVTWYLKDKTDEDARAEEIRLIKEAEEDALAVALGFTPTPRAPAGASRSGASPGALDPNAAVLEKAAKDARRREKEERKVARAVRREEKAKDPERHHHHHKSSRRHRDEEAEGAAVRERERDGRDGERGGRDDRDGRGSRPGGDRGRWEDDDEPYGGRGGKEGDRYERRRSRSPARPPRDVRPRSRSPRRG